MELGKAFTYLDAVLEKKRVIPFRRPWRYTNEKKRRNVEVRIEYHFFQLMFTDGKHISTSKKNV